MAQSDLDIVGLDARALAATGTVVAKLEESHAHLPTPCAGWTVTDLIGHLVDGNLLFAQAASGRTDIDWTQRGRHGLSAEMVQAYQHSTETVLSAFREPGVLKRTVTLPSGPLPGESAIAVHFVDVLVHGWDLAVAIGADDTLDDQLARAAVGIVELYPKDLFGDERFFAQQLPIDRTTSPGDELLRMTGRNPTYPERHCSSERTRPGG